MMVKMSVHVLFVAFCGLWQWRAHVMVGVCCIQSIVFIKQEECYQTPGSFVLSAPYSLLVTVRVVGFVTFSVSDVLILSADDCLCAEQ